jgi:UDP-glucose 4-epimerase
MGLVALVTGGCGLVGSTLVDLLAAQSDVAEIRVIDNLSRGSAANLAAAQASGKVRLYVADIRHAAEVQPLFQDVDWVFHQAALRITACAEQWRACQEVLVDGTFNVVEACVRAGVRRLIAASSASVYGMAQVFPTPETHPTCNNRTLYGAAKLANEALYRAFHEMTGLPYVALRYFNVYGPRMDVHGLYTEVLVRWLDALAAGRPPQLHGDGSQTMDFVYSTDVARANLLAARSNLCDEVFNVASGRETSLRELLALLLAAADCSHIEPERLPERRVNNVRRRLGCPHKARALLGFNAEVSLEEGLARLVQWHRQVKPQAWERAAA